MAAETPTTIHDPAAVGDAIDNALKLHGGVLFARPTMVHRVTYAGRDILAPNSRFAAETMDARGYVPVERWVMSLTQAQNPVVIEGEGVSKLVVPAEGGGVAEVALPAAAAARPLLGVYRADWPLTKVLDIGGAPVVPAFGDGGAGADSEDASSGGTAEVPGIPCHVHAGLPDAAGHCRISSGKLEAYFFPRVDVAPYNKDLTGVRTRLGLKPGTTAPQLLRALRRFALDDSAYALLNTYTVEPYDSWVIQPGVVHAPGPWLTFEIQRAQDDANLFAWQLGKAVPDDAERAMLKEDVQLCGHADEEALMRETVDWELNTEEDFESRWRRRTAEKPLFEGEWGRVLQTFEGDYFYGEAVELTPGSEWVREPDADERPFAGIVWSGQGTINGRAIAHDSADGGSEFLATPGARVAFANTGDGPLLVYTVFPIPKAPDPHRRR